MYSYTEIDLVFGNCMTKEECSRAREAFSAVANDQALPGKKIFYVRKLQRVREMELEKLKSN